jgi:superfamily II DNA or RNA helicase/HKD family nuclease
MAKLEPGLWEQLVTAGLRNALQLETELLADIAALDPVEAPGRIAQYLAPLIERSMRSLGEDETDRRLALANQLLSVLRTGSPRAFDSTDEDIDNPARMLLALTPRPAFGGEPKRLNRPYFPLADTALLTNAPDEPRVGHEIAAEIETADDVDLLCAFVRFEGVRIVEGQIRALIERGGRLRVITTTYLESTERRAVDKLIELGAEVKIAYEEEATRLHAKAWLFHRRSGFTTAFIGSSNLSRTALLDGLEWNVRLSSVATPELVRKFDATFESYWQAPRFETYLPDRDHERLDRALIRERPAEYVLSYLAVDIEPRPLQRRILEELEVERERHGRWKNLVVAATGTGKTVIAALDYRRLGASDTLPSRASKGRNPTLLFVAHRREILSQTVAMFRTVLRDGAFGELYVDGQKPDAWTHVFASVQSLATRKLDEVDPRFFDVLIIDEFHHAAAPTYRRILEHFQPALLLGLTATPERTDGVSVLEWFDGRMAAEVRLWEAIDEGELVPFQYFGISDDISLAQLEWRRGGYDVGALEAIYTGNDARVMKILAAIRDRVTDPARMRALGFCVSVEHARFMARRFMEAGIPSVAVTGETESDQRDDALRQLRAGTLSVVFAVDVFNEGVDVPEIDTVLFLRPTESATLFLQQLGRGLRRVEGKACLTVLDFIGRQRAEFRFDRRFQAITGRGRKQTERDIEQGFPFLPAGCHIQLDAVAREVVLENVRLAIGSRMNRLVEELRRAGDVALKDFLATSGSELRELYRPGRSWTTIRRRAGFDTSQPGPDEDSLVSAVGRMLHIEDDLRLRNWAGVINGELDASAVDQRILTMLYVDLWGVERKGDSVVDALARLRQHPSIGRELIELFEVLDSAAHVLPSRLVDIGAFPLVLHARYTQNEALAAIGTSTVPAPRRIREGVFYDRATDTDMFFFTLEKSERDFSPTTRYRDYAISPTLFHWESQSTTSIASPTGRRYVSPGSRPLLFVRKSKQGELGDATAYTYLGPAEFVSNVGERPMAITWRLLHAMPAEFFEEAAVAAV